MKNVGCVRTFVCLSFLWSQSAFHFLPVWLIIFSIVVGLPKKKKELIYFAFPFPPAFLPSFHSWHILAFLSLLYCLMNILFCDICFSTRIFLCDCFPFLSLICFQTLFSVFPLSTWFFYCPCFLLCVNPPPPWFCHPLNLFTVSSGSLTVPFITVWCPHHRLARDTLTLSRQPPACPWYPPHVLVSLQMSSAALGLGWDKRRTFSPVPVRICLHTWSVCHSDRDRCASTICKVHGLARGELQIIFFNCLIPPYNRIWCLSWVYETRLLLATSLWFWSCVCVAESTLIRPCFAAFIRCKDVTLQISFFFLGYECFYWEAIAILKTFATRLKLLFSVVRIQKLEAQLKWSCCCLQGCH